MAIDCRAEINWVFCQPAVDDAQLLSGTDLVAPRSGGHVHDPHRSVVSDAGMEILFPCRGWMVIGSSVSCCSWPWQTALGSTLNSYSGEGAQICSCFEKPPYSQARETSSSMFTDKSWKNSSFIQWWTLVCVMENKGKVHSHEGQQQEIFALQHPRNPKVLPQMDFSLMFDNFPKQHQV